MRTLKFENVKSIPNFGGGYKLKWFETLFSTRKSIQAKIFVTISLVILFSLITVSAIIYMNLTSDIKKNAINYVTDSIHRADKSLSTMLQDIDHISTVVVTNKPNVIDVLMSKHFEVTYEWFLEEKKIDGFLASLIAYKSYISRISVVGLNGKIFFEGNPWMDKSNLNKRAIEDIVAVSGNRVFIRQDAKETGGKEFVTIGRAIKYNKKPIGVVMIDLQFDVIKKAYDINPSTDSYIFVVENSGNFVYTSNPNMKKTNIRDTYLATFFQDMIGTNQVEEKEVDGKRHLIVSYKSEFTGWTTIAMIPEYALTRDSIKLRNQIIQIVIFVFLIVLFVSIKLASQITKNLKKLRNTMQRVKIGDLQVNSSIRSKDEVGQLNIVFNEMIVKLKDLMEDIKHREQQKREAELSALQAQISPHFLYNTLNTIKYLAKLQNATNIERVTVSLITLLRGVVGNTREFVTIREELGFVESYINIQKYKYIEPFIVNYQVDEELLNCKILKFILQPIVENAIIHGIGPLKEKGILTIKIQRDEDKVRVTIADNGMGMTEEQIQNIFIRSTDEQNLRFTGVGITNVHERIQIVYGESLGLEIYSQPGMYTTVELVVPFIKEGES
jgi:two-component system sensor histidine kinase YesM